VIYHRSASIPRHTKGKTDLLGKPLETMEENLPRSKRKQQMEIHWGDQQEYEQDASADNVSSSLPDLPCYPLGCSSFQLMTCDLTGTFSNSIN